MLLNYRLQAFKFRIGAGILLDSSGFSDSLLDALGIAQSHFGGLEQSSRQITFSQSVGGLWAIWSRLDCAICALIRRDLLDQIDGRRISESEFLGLLSQDDKTFMHLVEQV